jgi:hypothetical protein
MRNHFGIPDSESIAEPEAVQLLLSHRSIPHRFMDEPTQRIRQQQLNIDERHQQNVKVQLTSGIATSMENVHSNVTLPAKTLARWDELVKVVPPSNHISIQPPIALDFNDDDDDDDDDISTNLHSDRNDDISSSLTSSASLPRLDDTTTTVPSMSIYSLWHYHPPPKSVNDHVTNMNPVQQMSPVDIELSRIQYEMNLLQQELQQPHRSIDDIQEEMAQLKSLKRQLRWKKWLSW